MENYKENENVKGKNRGIWRRHKNRKRRGGRCKGSVTRRGVELER